jgi:hypothetical protein
MNSVDMTHQSKSSTRTRMLILAFILLCVSWSSACLVPECDNTHMQTSLSPDKQYVTTSYMIDCGAVGDYNMHVNVRPASDSFTPHGSGEIFAVKGPFTATPRWLDAQNLSIEVSCLSDSGCGALEREAFRHPIVQRDDWQQVRIHYSLRDTSARQQ